MQDKHVVIVRASEDRNIFINKVKYPKTVYQIEGKGNPEKDDILMNYKIGFPAIMSTWILSNWDNLPEFVIFAQANPDDHVESMLLAIDVDFTSDWGSFCYARSIRNQYSTSSSLCYPIKSVLNELGIYFHNDDNVSKYLYLFYPGDHFYISKKRILEKPKSFYEKLIYLDREENYFKLFYSTKLPSHVFADLNKHPEFKGLSKKEKHYRFLKTQEKDYGHFGGVTEIIFGFIFASEDRLKLLNNSQSVLGNKLYFKTTSSKYDLNFKFEKFPYSMDTSKTVMNFKLMENDWFDYESSAYKLWQKKLIEKTLWEGEQRGFNGQLLLDHYQQMGYKHISL